MLCSKRHGGPVRSEKFARCAGEAFGDMNFELGILCVPLSLSSSYKLGDAAGLSSRCSPQSFCLPTPPPDRYDQYIEYCTDRALIRGDNLAITYACCKSTSCALCLDLRNNSINANLASASLSMHAGTS